MKKDTNSKKQAVSSFRDIPFESEIMKKFISYQKPEILPDTSLENLTYKCSDIFPEWITSNYEWKGAKKVSAGSVADFLSRYKIFFFFLFIV